MNGSIGRTLKAALAILLLAGLVPLFAEGETDDAGVRNKTLSNSLLEQSYHEDDVRAIGTLVEALRLDPTNETAAYRTAYLYHKMNRTKEAVKYYEMTLSINPCNEKALNNLASLNYKMGRKQEAVVLYESATKCTPDFYLPYYNAGNIYRERDENEKAAEMYEKALKLNPGHVTSHHNLGVTCMALSRKPNLLPKERKEYREKALSHLKEASELSPETPLIRVTYGEILEEQGRLEEALKQYREAVRLYYDNINKQNEMKARVRKLEERLSSEKQ